MAADNTKDGDVTLRMWRTHCEDEITRETEENNTEDGEITPRMGR